MSEAILDEPSNAVHAAPAHASAWRWIVQALRSAVFLDVDWTGLRSGPGRLAAACLVNLAVEIVATRLYFAGPATFYWYALGFGWMPTALVAWGCWLALRRPAAGAVDAPTLWTMLWMQGVAFNVMAALVFVPLMRRVGGLHWPTGAATYLPTIAVVAWTFLAEIRLALAGTRGAPPWPRAGLLVTMLVSTALAVFVPFSYWQPARPSSAATKVANAAKAASAGASEAVAEDADEAADADTAAADTPMLKLSQETFERQQRLLASQLDALQPQRPGVVDLYAITFAPWSDVDVFMRESAVVADVMESRFDARGRTLQLVNNVATTDRLPWATPLNLQRAIRSVAQRMDRDNDILFIHLTSHGGADGHLAEEFFPLTMDEVTPRMLRQWLDDAHVRNRVISISACFSGSWVAPLADEDTLVMTAADADHTSYGCGSKSRLTFFGQAMYDEQLRHTWSFEQAHAAARKLIDQREHEAGKTDGYSNPQIRVGARIRERLKALEARLAASAP